MRAGLKAASPSLESAEASTVLLVPGVCFTAASLVLAFPGAWVIQAILKVSIFLQLLPPGGGLSVTIWVAYVFWGALQLSSALATLFFYKLTKSPFAHSPPQSGSTPPPPPQHLDTKWFS